MRKEGEQREGEGDGERRVLLGLEFPWLIITDSEVTSSQVLVWQRR